MGLNPDSITGDGGKAGIEASKAVFPVAHRFLDSFHVLYTLSKAGRSMEGKCLGLLKGKYKHNSNYDEGITTKAIEVFDSYEAEVKKLKEGNGFLANGKYVSADMLRGIIDSILLYLNKFSELLTMSSAIKKAISYLINGVNGIVAYKEAIEKAFKLAYGSVFDEVFLAHICPIIEAVDMYQRSYESTSKREFWGNRVSELRDKFRKFEWINQSEIDAAIQGAVHILSKYKKSNSLIEAANSVIRKYLNTYKSIPCWFCNLFTFFWNNRRFSRGKRAKLKPIEVLSGQGIEDDWLDTLLAKMHELKI